MNQSKSKTMNDIGDKYTDALKNILDLGSDGPRYIKFCSLLHNLYAQMKDGDRDAEKILDTLLPVSNLINLANKL